MKILDKSNWNRQEHFDFFSKYDNPFFGLVTEIDCTIAYATAKKKQDSFFATYLFKSILAANQIKEFKYRIQKKEVVIYDEIQSWRI